MTTLGEEALVVSLSPDEGRRIAAHMGIGAVLSAAGILDHWAAGAPLPPEKDLRKYMRKQRGRTLEPALAWFIASGRVTATRRWGHPDYWLADPASRAAVRDRLSASLSGPSVPARHDAGLAVLLHNGLLWDWAFDVATPRIYNLKPNWPGPLAARAAMLASGAAVPEGAAASDLPAIARLIRREIRETWNTDG